MKKYDIKRLADLYSVPADRRRAMFTDLETAMALHEFATDEIDPAMAFVWTDDGDRSATLTDRDGGDVLLKLKVRREAP